METVTITRRFEIDAGHRLMKHEGKCRNYHGHRYAFEVTLSGIVRDDGMILDFGIVKGILGKWLDDNWDHGMILQKGDPFLDLVAGEAGVGLPETKVYVLPCAPSSENLADYFAFQAQVLLVANNFPLKLTRVRVWETPNCYAEWSRTT